MTLAPKLRSTLLLVFRLLDVLGGQALRFTERLVLGFAAGVLALGLGVFGAGMLDGYGTAFFVAWPFTLLALGGPQAPRVICHQDRFPQVLAWP